MNPQCTMAAYLQQDEGPTKVTVLINEDNCLLANEDNCLTDEDNRRSMARTHV
jgi:hypothetical protein